MIRRGESIKKFGKEIGFVSNEKNLKMKIAVKNAKEHERFKQQRSEKIVKIIKHGLEDVYDIEVQSTQVHCKWNNFTQLREVTTLQAAHKIAQKYLRYWKTTTGAGLTATAVKDRIGKGWT